MGRRLNDGSVPLWIRNVLSLCNAQAGRITSEEIANIAALAGHFGVGSTMVSALRKNKNVQVEIVGEEEDSRRYKVKVYRVTRKTKNE